MNPPTPFMTFLWPNLLWAMLAVPLLVALYVFLITRRKKSTLRYANLGLVKEALGRSFVDWLTSADGQQTIASYKIDDQQLFFPNYRKPAS